MGEVKEPCTARELEERVKVLETTVAELTRILVKVVRGFAVYGSDEELWEWWRNRVNS